jgi:hypothetical protein
MINQLVGYTKQEKFHIIQARFCLNKYHDHGKLSIKCDD